MPRSRLVEILDVARMAPSNFNSQPWRVHVVEGAAKRALSDAISRAHSANTYPPFSPFPQTPPTDCAARVDDFGCRYYAALGIDRADIAARARRTGQNFLFFGAPVGFIYTIDSALTKHSWLDFGLFIQNVMLAAHARGLATCPRVSFVRCQSIIAEQLKLAPEEAVACGMSARATERVHALARFWRVASRHPIAERGLTRGRRPKSGRMSYADVMPKNR